MTAHFDMGETIPGRRLREVEVSYIYDPNLTFDASDDSCPPSPCPTYYLKVNEVAGEEADSDPWGAELTDWNWRYINMEKGDLVVFTRRGGDLVRRLPLNGIVLLKVVPEPDGTLSLLEIHSKPAEEGSEHLPLLRVQARTRKETRLWATALKENIQILAGVDVPLEDPDGGFGNVLTKALNLFAGFGDVPAPGSEPYEQQQSSETIAPGAETEN